MKVFSTENEEKANWQVIWKETRVGEKGNASLPDQGNLSKDDVVEAVCR